MDRLECFCRKHEKIYIYGAGHYGRLYFEQLKKMGYIPKGFIVSSIDEEKKVGNLPVYSAEVAKNLVTEDDGLIAGFKNASAQMLRERLGKDRIEIFSLENDLFPLFDGLESRFACQKDLQQNSWNNILVIRLDVLGDLVLTTPFIRELRRSFPNSFISLVILRQYADLFEACPYISKLILYECDMEENVVDSCREIGTISERTRLFAENHLMERNYDVVFLPRELLEGRNCLDEFLLAFYCNASQRIGRVYPPEWSFSSRLHEMFSVITKPNGAMHNCMYILDMLKSIGSTIGKQNEELWINEESRRFAEGIVGRKKGRDKKYHIALGLFSRDDTRTWAKLKFIKLMKELSEYYNDDIVFLLIGGYPNYDVNDILACRNTINLFDVSLMKTAACISLSDLYVGVNTGLLQMACAFQIPVVEISAWLPDGKKTDGWAPFRTGAWGVDSKTLHAREGYQGCRGMCRRSYAHCINQITVDEVKEAVVKMLEKHKDI